MDDSSSEITRFRSRLARVGTGFAALSAIVVGIVGITSMGSGPTASTTPVAVSTTDATPDFDAREARLEAETWLALVIGGETEAAQRISHPEAVFNFVGLSSSLGLQRGVASEVDSERFGSAELPQLCFAITARTPISSGSVVFRVDQGDWMLWEVRPSVERCFVEHEAAPIEPDVTQFQVIEPVPLRIFTAGFGQTVSIIDLQEGTFTTYSGETHPIENFAGAMFDRDRRLVVWTFEPTVKVFAEAVDTPVAFLGQEQLAPFIEDTSGVAPSVRAFPIVRDAVWVVGLRLDDVTATMFTFDGGNNAMIRSTAIEGHVYPVGATESGLILGREQLVDTGDGLVVDPDRTRILSIDSVGEVTEIGAGTPIALGGDHVVYIETGSTALFVLDLVSGERRHIGKPHPGEWRTVGGPMIPSDSMPMPTISPDGTELLISLGRLPDANRVPASSDLMAVDLTTGEVRTIASFEGPTPVSTWSSDGEWVAMFQRSGGGPIDVTVIDPDDPETTFIYKELIPSGQYPEAAG